MTLEQMRKEIDSIDDELLKLFARRMDASETVAKIKEETGMPVFQQSREDEIIEKAKKSVPGVYSEYAATFYSYLLELSRNLQRDTFRSFSMHNNWLEKIIEGARNELKFPSVSVQGIPGSYSTAAANRMYPEGKVGYVDRWEDVFFALLDGTADYGILPVENSSAGSVVETYDLLLKYKLYIVKASAVPVNHCLLGVRGAKLSEIREVYSHPHAFPQCAEFLKQNYKMSTVPVLNTAVAAHIVAKGGDRHKAAIASKECAHLYGLDILAESIQQSDSNCTRFVAVSNRVEIADNANKISVVFKLPHITGSLYRTLARFSHIGLNLTKIESRPIPGKNFEYQFYLDFTGNVLSDVTKKLLNSLSEELPSFSFIGNYNEPTL